MLCANARRIQVDLNDWDKWLEKESANFLLSLWLDDDDDDDYVYTFYVDRLKKTPRLTQKEKPYLNMWQLTTTSYTTTKSNLDFLVNLCAGETQPDVRGMRQI